jgi:hypothetical protein
VPYRCANWGNIWLHFAKSVTVCKQSAVPLFCSKLRNYIAAAASWSVLCSAFCYCLYYSHIALCSCAVYRKLSSVWSVWVTRPSGLLFLTPTCSNYYCFHHHHISLCRVFILIFLRQTMSLALQRQWTFKFLRSSRTEEFKFPTSSAPLSIWGIDLRCLTCRWVPYVV